MYTQENRLIAIDTPLGEDVFLLQGFSGREAISNLFSFNLAMESENDSISFASIIGQNVTIRLTLAHDSIRYWNGVVGRFTQSGSDAGFAHYQMEVVPWLWLLTLNTNCRIFQNKTVQVIVEEVFKASGFNDYRFSLTASYAPQKYCVQYRETDFNFVSRLLEQDGIFYYFEHEKGKHTLVIVDSESMLKDCLGQDTARYDASWGGTDSEDVITSWQMDQELRTGKCSVSGYNFTRPNLNLYVDEATIVNVGGNSRFELYEYPATGTVFDRPEFKTRAGLHMQEEEAGHLICSGTSGCRAFASGYTFALKEHPRRDMNDTYLLRDIQHIASVRGSYESGDDAGGFGYSNRFVCIPQSVPFRPARVTPKPFVQGSQTALVVGKEGEEIWTDVYGRVQVQFYWDRQGKKNEQSSCWIRVSQLWAGKGWGSMWIPRVGQEVVVSFLEGDPDRPIITGRVYNADQVIPYVLPDNQTVSTIKSRSTKGGNEENFNEIKFDDKKGHEDLTIHAENTMHNSVEGDQFITVGGDRNITTGGVGKDGALFGDVKELVFHNHNLHVKNDQISTIEGKQLSYVQNQAFHNYDHILAVTVQKDYFLEAKQVVMRADSIQLVAGGSSIVIDESGVSIVGSPLLKLNSGAGKLTNVGLAQVSDMVNSGDGTLANMGLGEVSGMVNSGTGMLANMGQAQVSGMVNSGTGMLANMGLAQVSGTVNSGAGKLTNVGLAQLSDIMNSGAGTPANTGQAQVSDMMNSGAGTIANTGLAQVSDKADVPES